MKNIQLLNIVSKYYLIDENIYLNELMKGYEFNDEFFNKAKHFTNNLIIEIRKNKNLDNVDNILSEYNLSNKEGIQIMCLAESLLRIPDYLTADSYLKDKISLENWDYYYNSDYWKIIFYNMIIEFISTIYYENIIKDKKKFLIIFKKTVVFFSNLVMKKISTKFVYTNNAIKAIEKSVNDERVFSFDMLGEASLTFYDSRYFYNQYKIALSKIAEKFSKSELNTKTPSISIKLSALHPKFSFLNRSNLYVDLLLLLNCLVEEAKKSNTVITIDAEECDRVDLTLSLFNQIYYSKLCKKWENFGIVVQSYSKRALPILFWLNEISKELKKTIPVRLVKGAYWDYEIKLSQFLNLKMYPVYTSKFCTDLSYLFCSIFLLSKVCIGNIIPQFATHNIQTICFVLVLCDPKVVEFQKLYGMGDEVYKALKKKHGVKIREYAPIGNYKELLPYLVRRLLENGANSSFVNKIIIKNIEIEKINENPIFKINRKYNTKIPLPIDLFGGKRQSISFYNLNISFHNYLFFKKFSFYNNKYWISKSIINKKKKNIIIEDPSFNFSILGIRKIDSNINFAINILKRSFKLWKKICLKKKIIIIENFISLLKMHSIEIINLCCKEAGKTIIDSISDLKEAIDFCYYYKNLIIEINKQTLLPSIVGENNIYTIEGKGIFAAISPWNFPIAIFCGQIIAALLTGNVVLSKPAENVSLISYKIISLFYKSGLPISVCQLVIGSGADLGNQISFNKNIFGVIFTGSNYIANNINKNLMMRDNRPIHKLIAETGGLNVMIADSTTLIEQLVFDVVESAFKSSGQRCSALRLLYLNEFIYFETIKLLLNVLKTIKIGFSTDETSDIGPVISKKSYKELNNYINSFEESRIYVNKEFDIKEGNYIFPTIIRVAGIKDLKSEQFGPILHIAMYKNNQINNIINDINTSEFGLTIGIHSRNETFFKYLSNNLNIGNIYVNRNIIGAVVGMQPFGGNNFSGTGPKAGGCNYMNGLINEKTVTINTITQGGTIDLFNE